MFFPMPHYLDMYIANFPLVCVVNLNFLLRKYPATNSALSVKAYNLPIATAEDKPLSSGQSIEHAKLQNLFLCASSCIK